LAFWRFLGLRQKLKAQGFDWPFYEDHATTSSIGMEITARCPYCGNLNTYDVEPNVAVIVTCSCRRGSFYVKKVDRIEVVRNSLWTWDGTSGERQPNLS
jgi:hypothetical protein